METKKLSFGTKFGYSIGMIGECVAMNTFYIYFLFFLTDGVAWPLVLPASLLPWQRSGVLLLTSLLVSVPITARTPRVAVVP